MFSQNVLFISFRVFCTREQHNALCYPQCSSSRGPVDSVVVGNRAAKYVIAGSNPAAVQRFLRWIDTAFEFIASQSRLRLDCGSSTRLGNIFQPRAAFVICKSVGLTLLKVAVFRLNKQVQLKIFETTISFSNCSITVFICLTIDTSI